MKILLLSTHFNLGGIGIYMFSLAKGLVQKGHTVFIASCGGDLVAKLESIGARHFVIDIKTKSEISPKVFFARPVLSRIIKENDIEIIHAHTRVTQVLAEAVAKSTGTPFVTTCHGFFKPRLFRRIFPCWGQTCIAISEAVREHLVNDLRFKKEAIVVVHNGIELNRFSPDKFSQQQKDQSRSGYGLKLNAPLIGTVARFSSVKGQCFLISAMKEVVRQVPEAQLLLVGEGPEKEALVSQVGELKLEDNVFFGSATMDTTVPLSIMDIFVFPSLNEGLGLAIIEAQAMELAVIASDVGGIYTVVQDGVNGLLVHPGDPHELAEAIFKLLNNKKLAQELARQGREQALRRFDLDQMVDGIEQVYLKNSRQAVRN
ncbi:MAG: glycosyltransferase family 4 protein [Candidatus Omnitrophica bacterium]|nr:glycosyltransferase family 4 protein [Candidatus Omnitrophota bacterium]